MAFVVTDRVRVADQSSQWRGLSGEVMLADDPDYDVRLDGHACGTTQRFLERQLQADATAEPLDYSRCTG